MTDQAVIDRMAHARAAKEAKEAAKPILNPEDELPEGFVRVRVLPLGDDKIATGVMNTLSLTDKFPRHKRNDRLALPRDVAEAQERNGYVEIL